jgi:hypothetical protein
LVKQRRGASSLGCLFTLLIVATVVYFGVNVGEIYWRYYEFRDDMRQEVRFANSSTNERILARLRARADSLDLPEDARDIMIRRTPKGITIDAEYYERIELPMYARDVLFRPHAEGPL